MKKIYYLMASVAVCVSLTLFFIDKNEQTLFDQNVEALTSDESNGLPDNWNAQKTWCDHCQKTVVPSCFWNHAGEGKACTPGACSTHPSKKGSYVI